MSCTPKRSCQQAAKATNAPLTPGLSVLGALEDEEDNSPSSQAQGREEVAEGDRESLAGITHQWQHHLGATFRGPLAPG